MDYQIVKSLHIIFVVTWFAGLFYIVRLFVYHYEAAITDEPERGILIKQFQLMEKRLWYGITWPSLIGTYIFGIWMILLNPFFLKTDWMQLKLLFVLGLTIYHFSCQAILNQLKKNIFKYSSQKMRIWNEVATLFLVAIVFLVVAKNTIDYAYGLIGLVAFGVLLMLAIKAYKRIRER